MGTGPFEVVVILLAVSTMALYLNSERCKAKGVALAAHRKGFSRVGGCRISCSLKGFLAGGKDVALAAHRKGSLQVGMMHPP